MENENIPRWFLELNDEEIKFVKNFLLASGSIKELAGKYSTSYPTIRKNSGK